MTVTSINSSNGTVTGDNHNSAVSGWASLGFTAVNATGIRIGFSNPPGSAYPNVHYRVYEFELFGSSGATGTTPTTITFGQTVNGTLSASLPQRSTDCPACYAEVYQLTVTGARAVVITMSSTAFDAYLNLLDENGNILASNDDGGDGFNARLTGIIQPGVYRIEATSANPQETGAYVLAIAP